MPNAFTRLRKTLAAVEQWLPDYLQLNLSKQERDLAISLQKYVGQCYRDKRKWRSELAAEHAIIKIDGVWFKLYTPRPKRN